MEGADEANGDHSNANGHHSNALHGELDSLWIFWNEPWASTFIYGSFVQWLQLGV
jgi:hypothetical protein